MYLATSTDVDKDAAIFRGLLWVDENENGKIDDGERGVSPATVSLRRKATDGGKSEHVKEVSVKADGSYELKLKGKRIRTDNEYYPRISRHGNEALFRFSERIKGGDSHVNAKGNSAKALIESGKTYEINAGVALTGVVFHGREWFDDNANGLMDKGEPGVGSAVITLYRKTLTNKSKVVKQTEAQSDGVFEIQLRSIKEESKYYLKFQHEEHSMYVFTSQDGDSAVNWKGNTARLTMEYKSRHKFNAGIVPERRAVFYGKVWFDDNANGLIEDGEEGVGTASISLYRQSTVPNDVFVKRITAEPNGTFALVLKYNSATPGASYYLRFQHEEGSRYAFVPPNVGGNGVDEEGRTSSFTVENGRRYQINAGITQSYTTIPTQEEYCPTGKEACCGLSFVECRDLLFAFQMEFQENVLGDTEWNKGWSTAPSYLSTGFTTKTYEQRLWVNTSHPTHAGTSSFVLTKSSRLQGS